MFDFNSVQVGDSIGVDAARFNSGLKISEVVKVTKTQVTVASGRKFNKYGEELKSRVTSYPRARLLDLETAQSILNRNELQKQVNNSVKNIADKVAGRKNGLGDFFISEEDKAMLIQMIQDCPVNC